MLPNYAGHRLADSDKVKTLLQVHLLRREPGYPARTHKHDTNAAPDTGQDRNSSFRPQRRAVFILHAETRAHPGRSSFDRSLQDAVVVCDPEHFTGARDPGEANPRRAKLWPFGNPHEIKCSKSGVRSDHSNYFFQAVELAERASELCSEFQAAHWLDSTWGLAKLDTQPNTHYIDQLTKTLPTTVQDFSAAQISKFAWALSVLKVNLSQKCGHSLMRRAAQTMPSAEGRDVAISLSSFAALGLTPEHRMADEAMQRATALMHHTSPQCLTKIMEALAELHIEMSSPFFQASIRRAVEEQDHLGPVEFNRMMLPDSSTVKALLHHLAHNISDFNLRQTNEIIWVCSPPSSKILAST
eukprot:3450019-Rhodomonas_salina.1